MKTVLAILFTLAIAVPATWYVTRNLHHSGAASAADAGKTGGRKLLYYQSAMHPWIKSDKPGRCTICGMELTPVYEGDSGFDASGGDVVPLTQTMIQVMSVQTAQAQVRPLTKTLTVAGIIDDDATHHRVLSAYVPGRIEKLYVNYLGAEVHQGQPLAEYYSPALLQSEREYRSLTGELRDAVGLRLRQFGLSAEQIAAIPTKPADQLTTQILAPFSGTVIAQNVYAGQYVQEGEKLFELADFSTMWFQFRAYEQDLPWVRVGLKVDITSPSHPGYIFPGTVAFIDPTLEEATRAARVRVELKNPPAESGHRMMHKLYADGLIHLDAPEVLTVPRTAVIETGPEAVAYVDQGKGVFARRVLKLGRRGDTLVEIVSGVAEGDKVVVNGNLLIDGQAEMNRAFAPAPEHAPSTMAMTNSITLTDSEKQALVQFVKVADQVSAALAKDDIAAFNAVGPEAAKATDALVESLKSHQELADVLKHLAEARQLQGGTNLATARKIFHPYSNSAAKLLEMVGSSSGSPPFDLFECSMVDHAIPGVPKNGRWIQSTGRNLANPYFGAEMLECGEKVKR